MHCLTALPVHEALGAGGGPIRAVVRKHPDLTCASLDHAAAGKDGTGRLRDPALLGLAAPPVLSRVFVL